MKLLVNPVPGAPPLVPALVWEAAPNPAKLTESGHHWEMTNTGLNMTRPRAGEPLIFPVEKVLGTTNAFAMGVTIGRVESNDIVVDDGSVSRFHAWIQRDDRTQQWSLTDAESKNGTWLDGVPLAAKQRVALRDGARLKFGDVEMEFFLPASLKTFVEQRFRAVTG